MVMRKKHSTAGIFLIDTGNTTNPYIESSSGKMVLLPFLMSKILVAGSYESIG